MKSLSIQDIFSLRKAILYITFLLGCLQASIAQDTIKLDRQALNGIKLFDLKTLNSDRAEFAPSYFQEGIIYVGEAVNDISSKKGSNEGFFDLFYVSVNDFGIPNGTPEELSAINSDYHEGPMSYDKNTKTLFFTRSNMESGRSRADENNTVQLQILTSKLVDGRWTRPKKWKYSSDSYSICHPSLSADGNRIYFASNMGGGFGGMDIYYSDLLDGEWSEPRNLGPEINTNLNDWFPFIHDTGALFFCSEGHPGFGGLDVFIASQTENEIGEIQNLGAVFNNSADQAGFILNTESTRGYFVTADSSGMGDDDIYLFDSRNPLLILSSKLPARFECLIQLRDSVSQQGITAAPIEIYDFDEYIKNPDVRAVISGLTDDKGYIRANVQEDQRLLILTDPGGNYEFTEWVRTANHLLRLDITEKKEVVIEAEETIPSSPTNIRTATITSGAVVSLDNIYYDYNKTEIQPGAAEELEILAKIMKDYPIITIILTAHTDSRGTEVFNQSLSEKRAQAAKEYLVKRGIEENRISTLGMGESRLRNHCKDGVNCSEAEHQYNRRTEVRIVTAPANIEIRFQDND